LNEGLSPYKAAKKAGIAAQTLYAAIARTKAVTGVQIKYIPQPVLTMPRAAELVIGLTYTGRDICGIRETSPAMLGAHAAFRRLRAVLIGCRNGMRDADTVRRELTNIAAEHKDTIRIYALLEDSFPSADVPATFVGWLYECDIPEWIKRGCKL
jgi:hypothetical protein